MDGNSRITQKSFQSWIDMDCNVFLFFLAKISIFFTEGKICYNFPTIYFVFAKGYHRRTYSLDEIYCTLTQQRWYSIYSRRKVTLNANQGKRHIMVLHFAPPFPTSLPSLSRWRHSFPNIIDKNIQASFLSPFPLQPFLWFNQCKFPSSFPPQQFPLSQSPFSTSFMISLMIHC